MIVYNQDRIRGHYLTGDHVILEINSTKKLEELLQMLLDGQEINTVAAVNGVIVRGTDKNAPHKTYGAHRVYKPDPADGAHGEQTVPNYYLIHDEEYDDDYDRFIPSGSSLPYMDEASKRLFTQFEKRLMGARDARLEFDSYPVTDENGTKILKEQLACAIGIMPVILNAPEAQGKPVAELKKLSQQAEIGYDHGIADYFSHDYPDLLPEYQTAEMLAKLSNPERALIADGLLNPALLTDYIFRKKEKYGKNTMLTEDDVARLVEEAVCTGGNNHVDPNGKQMSEMPLTGISVGENKLEALVEASTRLFTEKFHFVPRVIREYCQACMLVHMPVKTHDIPEISEKLVEEFSRTSLSKVAGLKNMVLYAFSPLLNFAEVKEDHMQAIGTFYPEQLLCRLDRNGFVAYYRKYNDMSLGELTKLLRLYRNNPELVFEQERSPKEIISRMENKRGVEDCERFERHYGYSFKDNDIAIRGRNIMAADGQMRMYMLPPDDYRNFTTGYDTNCCQHYGSAGESCVYKLTTDPFAANVVIERNGKILAQGFVWTDEGKDTLVFDNVEFADDRSVQQFNDLFAAWSAAMPYKNIHVGVGYNQGMQSWGRRITEGQKAVLPQTVSSRVCYSDYGSAARALKSDGRMNIHENKSIQIVQQPLTPSRYDEINRLGLTYLVSTGFSLTKMLEIAGKLQAGTLAEEEYRDLFRAVGDKAALLDHMEHIPDNIQLWLMDTCPSSVVEQIKNPCEQVLVRQVEQNPAKIRLIANPTEDMQLAVVRKNGLLLSEIASPTDAVIYEAVRQNGVALTMVSPEKRTDALIMLAIRSWAKVIASIDHPTPQMIDAALEIEPGAVALIRGEIPVSCQMNLVNSHPSFVNDIPSPHPSVVRRAIELDGRLIRNYQSRYPELRMTAIRQNPFAIGALNRPTVEEIYCALAANPGVRDSIRDKEALASAQALLAGRDCEQDMELAM